MTLFKKTVKGGCHVYDKIQTKGAKKMSSGHMDRTFNEGNHSGEYEQEPSIEVQVFDPEMECLDPHDALQRAEQAQLDGRIVFA